MHVVQYIVIGQAFERILADADLYKQIVAAAESLVRTKPLPQPQRIHRSNKIVRNQLDERWVSQ